MKLKDLKGIFHKELDPIYGKEEVFSFFFMCLESFYNISRLQLALNVELSITKEEQEPIFNALELLKQEQPIQYILGETEFYGLPFKINTNTLIPRPETEELVDWVIKDIKADNKKDAISILDIGTGSGCIAITLAKKIKQAKVHAVDVSKKALITAQENANLNNVDVQFVETNILNTKSLKGCFDLDIVVSNPPYVRELEKQEMKANVLDNEPHLALFVDNDNALVFYKAITEFAEENLKPNGQLYFEINEYLAEEMKNLVASYGFNTIEVRKDMFGKYRMLRAVKINRK